MTNIGLSPFLLSVAVTMLLSFSCRADAKIIDENFESYSGLPQPLEGLHPGDAGSSAWATAGFDIAGASAQVVEGTSTTGSGANRQVLHLVRPEEPFINLQRRFDTVTADTAPQGIRAGMKFMVSELREPSDLVFGFLDQAHRSFNVSSLNAIFRLRFQEPNHSTFYYRSEFPDAPGETYVPINEIPFVPGQWYEIVITLKLAEQTWAFELANLDTGERTAVSDIDIPVDQTIDSVSGLGLSHRTPPAAMNHFFDDIFVEIVE